jgi:hypothetical protein
MTNANVTLSPYERAVNILNELTPHQDTIVSAALDDLRAALATAQAERAEALMECNCAVLERDAALQRAEQAEAACSRKPDPPGGTMTEQQTMIGTEVTR